MRRYPGIRFILSHAGGFVPYASHRLAIAIAGKLGRSLLDVLGDFRGFYFDTALSSSPAALPTLLAFARPGHVLFGSDWPFAPTTAGQYFATGLDTYDGLDDPGRIAINAGNAAALFPRLGIPPTDGRTGLGVAHLRAAIRRAASRAVFSKVLTEELRVLASVYDEFDSWTEVGVVPSGAASQAMAGVNLPGGSRIRSAQRRDGSASAGSSS